MKKVCTKCNKEKEIKHYYKSNWFKDGFMEMCKSCHKSRVNTNKQLTLEEYPKRMYNNQRQNSKKRKRPYPNYTYEEFKEYLFNNTKYIELYKAYEESGFDKYLAPSTDRINPLGSYTFDNIQVITWRDNLSKAGEEAILTKNSRQIIHYQLDGERKVYKSITEIHTELNLSEKHIYNSCNYLLAKYPNGIFRWKNVGEVGLNKLSYNLVQLLKRKKIPHGNKGKMSPKQEAHLKHIQEQNRLRFLNS